MILFKHGDCKDASIGTLLLNSGVEKPEVIIFKDLRFTIKKTKDSYRVLELAYRVEDFIDEVTRRIGIAFKFHHFDSNNDFIYHTKRFLSNHIPVVVVVDHYEYKHSQFFKSGHMPHFVILTDFSLADDLFSYVDPFSAHDVKGLFTPNDLKVLCDSKYLLNEANTLFVLDLSEQRYFNPDHYLMDTWQDTVRRNLSEMLDEKKDGDLEKGVNAIKKMASYLQDWVNKEEFVPFKGQEKKFPINSFLDLGSNRAGHAVYLRHLGELLEDSFLCDISDQFKKIAINWDMVSSIRNFYQEKNLKDTYDINIKFIEKNLRRVPDLINNIAEAEEKVLLQFKEYMKGRGIL